MSLAWVPRWLFVLVLVVLVVIVAALVISALGGFDWLLHIGRFHLDIGVSKQ